MISLFRSICSRRVLFALFLAPCTLSQSMAQGNKTVYQDLASQHLAASLADFIDFLSLPCDAHYPDDLEKNIDWIIPKFEALDFSIERLPTEGIDLILAERPTPQAEKTVLIYLQVDGQPVDPTKWHQHDPFMPELKVRTEEGWEIVSKEIINGAIDPEWRIFARAASDAKGPIAAFLTALQICEEQGWTPNYNIKIIMDCEEELGSPNLPAAVMLYRDKLSADMLIIFDGPRHISNQPTLTFGARGITTLRITTFGPRVPQHSGHYGNYAPNPALHLAQLLASMKDDVGRVTIPGFYDGISLDEKTKTILAGVPDDEAVIQQAVGIATPDQVGANYQEAIQYPSLNIRGMLSGWVGAKARTIVPHVATVNIDIRTVLESDPERLVSLVRQHILDQGYHICAAEPTEEERMTYPRLLSMDHQVAYQAFRTDFDSEVGVWLNKALTNTFGESPIRIRTSGGSIPISPFVQTLGIPAVTVPAVNRDNNQHSPNENIRIGNYLDAIRTYLGILTEKL